MSTNGDGDGAVKLQDPDETVKPELKIDTVPDIIWSLYGLKVNYSVILILSSLLLHHLELYINPQILSLVDINNTTETYKCIH